jgi:ribonucleotide reductase alpha subunit
MELRLPFESEGARQLNKDIFETIYFAALTKSCELAQQQGTYESYAGSPVSKGVLQPDMWGVTPSDRHDWATLVRGAAIDPPPAPAGLVLTCVPRASWGVRAARQHR